MIRPGASLLELPVVSQFSKWDHLSPLDDSSGSETLLQYGDFTEPRQ